MQLKIKIVIYTSIAVTVLFALYLKASRFYHESLLPVSESKAEVVFRVEPGSSFKEVAENLEQQGLIRSKKAFFLLAWLQDATTRIQAGLYKLSPSQSAKAILETFLKGKTWDVVLTFPEGYNMYQIANVLDRAGLVSREDFLKAAEDPKLMASLNIPSDRAEGYLFPDTYLFSHDDTPENFIRSMVGRFWKVWEDNDFGKRAEELKLTIHEVVTLASIVEKEAVANEERPVIASVFWNRIKRGMRLQSDPTVKYIAYVNKPRKRRWKYLKKIASPYNTYKYKGLPKGPIANPGRDAIRAVLYPANTNYLYFVSQKNGRHYFSVTLKEHNRAVNRFLKSKRRKKAARASRRLLSPPYPTLHHPADASSDSSSVITAQ